MCFSKGYSLFHFGLLTIYAAYLYTVPNDKELWRLYFPIFYLGIKDLLQAILYSTMSTGNSVWLSITSVLSYVHIAFQPLLVNLFASYFSANTTYYGVNYWNMMFIILTLFGLYKLTNLNVFDIFRETPYCKDKQSDFCADKNGAYQGKYHVGYRFKTKYKYDNWFLASMAVPALFTAGYPLSILFSVFTVLLRVVFYDVRDGELGALWCLLTVLYCVPVTYFREYIKNALH